jgi:hypothetical protein
VDGSESNEMKAIIDNMIDQQDLSERERRELAVDTESRKLLFWNGYEREFT